MPADWPKALWLLRHGESAGNVARDAEIAVTPHSREMVALKGPRTFVARRR